MKSIILAVFILTLSAGGFAQGNAPVRTPKIVYECSIVNNVPPYEMEVAEKIIVESETNTEVKETLSVVLQSDKYGEIKLTGDARQVRLNENEIRLSVLTRFQIPSQQIEILNLDGNDFKAQGQVGPMVNAGSRVKIGDDDYRFACVIVRELSF